jgi:replicative DNA helicase
MEKKQLNNRYSTSKHQSKFPSSIFQSGMIPPQALELEEAVLGAMLLNKNVIDEIKNTIHKDCFYEMKHVYIYGAIEDLYDASHPVDLLTVVNRLREKGELELAGGVVYLSKLSSKIGSTANSEFHARIISQKFIQREIICLSSEMLTEAFSDSADIFELLNKVDKDLFKIYSENIKKGVDDMRTAVAGAIAEIEVARQNTSGISGVPTGFIDLDRITAGWQRSDMIVIAARPAMGKTAFTLSMARNIAVDYKKAVAIFSLEMSSVQLVKRLMSSESRLNADKLRTGKLEEHEMQQLHTRISKLVDAPIYIDDTAGISVYDFRAKCRRLKKEKNIEIIIIDYLQLMSAGPKSGNGSREQEISIISRTIKEIAKELNVPIIALSQLSRSVETRGGNGVPMLSDLRESGSIEQDADIVSFIYRPEKYHLDTNQNGESNLGVAEIIIAKHRNGDLGTVKLEFVGKFALFKNFETFFEPEDEEMDKLTPNQGFDNQTNSFIIQSKINNPVSFKKGDSEPFTDLDDVPF